ncbi:hypothetical protein LCGC14_1715000 [marine sediment metagenome]|uniref:Uncharacterized protein n=1 Tax=marine sediment metagenome TaxID=412755 RepID=A0A0F9KE60_9ZZZZ
MRVVPPNEVWLAIRSHGRALTLGYTGTLLGIPIITIPRIRTLTVGDVTEGDDLWGQGFVANRFSPRERAAFEIQYQGDFCRSLLDVENPAVTRQRIISDVVSRLMGDTMARRRDNMILNYFFPIPANTEDLAALYEAMGITPLDGTEAGGYLSSGVLLGQAKTLRQRCFARLFSGFDKASGSIRLMYVSASGAKIKPFANTLRSLMPACYRNKKLRKSLASIPIASGAGRRGRGRPPPGHRSSPCGPSYPAG